MECRVKAIELCGRCLEYCYCLLRLLFCCCCSSNLFLFLPLVKKKNFFFFSAARADQTLRRSHHSQEEWKERKGKYHHPHNSFPFILRCKINVSRKYFLFRVKIPFKIRTKIFSNYDEWVKTFPNNSCQRGKWVFYSEFSHMNEHGGRARKFFFRYVLASWQEVASVRPSVMPLQSWTFEKWEFRVEFEQNSINWSRTWNYAI